MKTLSKKSFIILIAVIALVVTVTTVITVVWAFMFKSTKTYDNEFEPAHMSCEVVENFDGTKKTSVKIKNTSNISAYLRLRLVSYWQDTKGFVVQRESIMPSYTVNSADWLSLGDHTYCYKYPIEPGDVTGELLKSSIDLHDKVTDDPLNDGVVYEYEHVIEIIAEAIQAEPADAVENSWNVTIDGDGNIVAVK